MSSDLYSYIQFLKDLLQKTERSIIAIVRTVIKNEIEATKGLRRAKKDRHCLGKLGKHFHMREKIKLCNSYFASVLSIRNNDLLTGKKRKYIERKKPSS